VIDPEERESGEQRQAIGSPADILPYYLNKTRIEEHSPELNQAGVTHNTKGGKEKVPQV
jgi:hypothetical protein